MIPSHIATTTFVTLWPATPSPFHLKSNSLCPFSTLRLYSYLVLLLFICQAAAYDPVIYISTAVNYWYDYRNDAEAKYGPISEWDVSQATSGIYAFMTRADFNEDISNWDTSSFTSMKSMFSSASSFNQNIGKWDVSKVTDMDYMFSSDDYWYGNARSQVRSAFNNDISGYHYNSLKR